MSFSSLGQALRRLNLEPSSAAEPAAEPALDAEPPPVWAVDYAEALLRVDTRRNWVSILGECLDAQSRAGRERWNRTVSAALDNLPARDARELDSALRDWTSKGVPTWVSDGHFVLRALRCGFAAKRQKERAAAPVAPAAAGFDNREAFEAATEEWLGTVTRAQAEMVLKGDTPQRWASSAWSAEEDRREVARKQTAAGEARRNFAALIAAGDLLGAKEIADQHQELAGALRPHAAKEVKTLLDKGDDPEKVRWAWAPYGDEAVVAHPAAWEAALYQCKGVPPQGWGRLSDAALVKLWHHGDFSVQEAAQQALWSRTPLGGVFHSQNKDLGADVRGPQGWVTAYGIPWEVDTVAFTPSPAGWVSGRRWVEPRVYAALTRLQAKKTGNCDVRHVVSYYKRNSRNNFPCLFTEAWKTPLLVGVDDQLGQVLDDLRLCHEACPGAMTPDMYRIPASARRTAAGGLQITAHPGQPMAIYLVADGSHGYGAARPEREATSISSALSVSAFGRSNGGGVQAVKTFAVLTRSTPFLASSGEGFTLGEGFEVFRVPGLAIGCPGQPRLITPKD